MKLNKHRMQEITSPLISQIWHIRFINSCEMDTIIKIKEEDPLSNDLTSQKETELFTNFTMKAYRDAVHLESDCEVAFRTGIKCEIPFPDYSAQNKPECFIPHPLNWIKSETVTHRNKCEIDTKIEISLQRDSEFLLEDSVKDIKKCSSDHEMDNKLEIHENPWWKETEASFVFDGIKDEDFTPVKSPRWYTEAASGNSIDGSMLSSAEVSGEKTSLNFGKDCVECEIQESNLTKLQPEDKHVQSQQPYACSDGREICSRALMTYEGEKSHKHNICEKSFTQLSELNNHSLIHEDKKTHKCEICEKSFKYLSHLKRHVVIHEAKMPHKCEICEKSFKYLFHLKSHVLLHDQKPHRCKICEKSFTLLSDLQRHILIHNVKKPYKCEICDKRFTYLSHMKTHNLIHEGIKPHKCKICEKSFTQVSNLNSHILIHEGKKPHKCKYCEKSFTQSSHLKDHILIHEGKKPHKCDICVKSFTRSSELKRHILMHAGIKPHKCKICERSFSDLSNLKSHILIHEGKKPYKCDICQKSFTQSSTLKSHISTHEGKKPHKCETCDFP